MSDTHTVEVRQVAAVPAPACPHNGVSLAARLRKRMAGQGHEFVLEVEFEAAPGFTILFGASGAGKTTLLDCVAGLATPDAGRIAIGNRVLFDSEQGADVAVAKRRVGYVFQDLALFPHLTVEQNVEYGLAHLAYAERRKRAAGVLQAFHIAHLARRSAREISGGESQRVALARTLVTDPAVLLLDEPLAALDAPTKAKIIDDLREWNRSHRIPILYVTHSREEVFALGERVIVLDAGRIVAEGTPHEVMTAPRQEAVAQLAGFENIFDATVEAVHPERGTMVCRINAAVGQPGKGTASVSKPALSEPEATRKNRSLPSGKERYGALAPEEILSFGGLHPRPGDESAPAVLLETPLVRADVGSALRVGIRAGDILLATSLPQGLSARNLIPGRVTSLEQRDVIVSCRVSCGAAHEGVVSGDAINSGEISVVNSGQIEGGLEMEVHLTLAARDSLKLAPDKEVWLVIKTHSCHLMRG
jgi:molybdate transport system ATP-binding protein